MNSITTKTLKFILIAQITALIQGAQLVGNQDVSVTSDRNTLPKVFVKKSNLRAGNIDVTPIVDIKIELDLEEDLEEDSEEEDVIATEPQECILKVTLGYPSHDPEVEPLKKHHSNLLFVVRGEGEDPDHCLPKNSHSTDWCTHENDGGEYDKYYNDIHTIEGVAGTKTTFTTSHWYHQGEFYDAHEEYIDVRVPAVLSITNESKDILLSPDGGWAQPIVDIEDLKNDSSYTPVLGHEGRFSVIVTCTSDCDCDAHYTTSMDEYIRG